MKNPARILFSLYFSLTAGACDSEHEGDNSGCDPGRDLEATVVAIEPVAAGMCDRAMIVRADFVDPSTGETVYWATPLFGGAVPQAWLDERGFEVGAVLDAHEAGWCEGGGIDLHSEDFPPSC